MRGFRRYKHITQAVIWTLLWWLNGQKDALWKMNDEEKICFKSTVRHVLTEAAKEYTRENKCNIIWNHLDNDCHEVNFISSLLNLIFAVTPQTLLQLRCVFGDTFESALELYEKKKVTCFSAETTRYVNKDRDACWFYEVQGSSPEVYTIFPSINFCSCTSFE